MEPRRSERTGADATEAAVRAAAPAARFLHFATHGYFAPPSLRTLTRPRELGRDDLAGDRGATGRVRTPHAVHEFRTDRPPGFPLTTGIPPGPHGDG